MSDSAGKDEMAKAYDPSKVEGPLYQMWLEGGYFRARIDPSKEPFCIIMPPPNVTGELHLGHALTATIEDCLVRWHRMRGDPTLWLPGVDHAGIATQNVVEKQLAKEGLTRQDLGREQFLERVWQWVRKYRGVIAHQHARLGASCDWDREVFTMDEGPQKAVRTTFAKLYNEDLIYRGERIINWCPYHQTAISDLEVEHEYTDGKLWYVRYPLVDEGGHLTDEYVVVATTRPETIVADVALAVNPTVERWKAVVGRKALLPIIERHIPVIADDAVDPAYGTGALKITPGHDPVDFEIGQRHGVQPIVAIAADGTMNAEAGPYEGMDRFDARKTIVADLERLGLIEKIEDHRYALGHCERCGTIVEPVLSKQWFVKMESLARPAIEAVRDGRVRIVPSRFDKEYFHWMENIRDWCISRQLWWGHRIPVWYCRSCGEQIASVEDPTACANCGSNELEQDPDVLDTWFSSGLWPNSTLGWPEETEDLRYWYPTSVLETGYDILFFWVARMIMMGLYNMGDVPFRHVYLHGLIRDSQGRKMTKSLGNVVDPLEAIEKYGCDALRFTLATGGAPGNDFRLSDERLESARNFANKIWNASRFVISNLEAGIRNKEQAAGSDGESPLEDRWILSRLDGVSGEANKLLSEFQINEAARLLYEFFWNEYCDWYLEMAKVRLKAGDDSPLPVLVRVLQSSMRLLHPFMPFVTEAIWQHLRKAVEGLEPESIIVAAYPPGDVQRDAAAEGRMQTVIDVVRAIRNIRAERGVDPGRYVEAYISSDGALPTLEAARPMVEALARVRPLHLVSDAAATPKMAVASTVLAEAQVVLPLAGMIDVEAERSRLSAQLLEAENEVRRLEGKLSNEQFRSKAPPEVVRREEEKLASARARTEGLRGRLAELE
jgi:valyl-tRNA synthetase